MSHPPLPPGEPGAADAPAASRAIRTVLVVEDDPGWEAEALDAVAVFPEASVRTARTLAQAEVLAQRGRFDLALVDLGLPDGSGVTLIRRLCAAAAVRGEPAPVCVARTVFDDDDTLLAALGAGAHGFLLKGEAVGELRARLLAAARGEPVLSPQIARRVLARFRQGAPPAGAGPLAAAPGAAALTAREAEVLGLVARGLTVPEVSGALGVSPNTVKSHVRAAYLKLDVRTRVEAAQAARRLGLVTELEP